MATNELITVLVGVAFVLLLVVVGLNDRRMRRKSNTPLSGMVASFDQAFHPEAAKAMEIREIQRELPAESALSGAPLMPGGTIVVSVPGVGGRKADHHEGKTSRLP